MKQSFCFCDREPKEESQSKKPELQSQMKKTEQSTLHTQINTTNNETMRQSFKMSPSEYDESHLPDIMEDSVEIDVRESEEYKTSVEVNNLMHEGNGLLVKYSSVDVYRQRKTDSYQSFIMKVLHEKALTPEQQVRFTKLLVSSSISEQTARRVRQDSVLIAHDPTGSFLIKHLPRSTCVYCIDESTTYQEIINEAVSMLNFRHKLFRVIKAEIELKVDTAIVNLFHIDVPLNIILKDYFGLAHDIIVVLDPKIENYTIIEQMKLALTETEQSKTYCAIDLQSIYLNGKLIAKIVYFGEVSLVTQNHQLNYLYQFISEEARQQYKYKTIIKELRSQMGMMKLIELFAESGQFEADADFDCFFRVIRKTHLSKIKTKKLIVVRQGADKSSTESEDSNEDSILKSQRSSNKIHSKSEQIVHETPKPKYYSIVQKQQPKEEFKL